MTTLLAQTHDDLTTNSEQRTEHDDADDGADDGD